MASSVATRSITALRVRLGDNLDRLIERISLSYERGSDIIQLKGFPLRIFCCREPEDVRQILTHARIGQTKLPSIMPRVKSVMGQGAYIMAGGATWREKRQKIQPAFSRQVIPRIVEETAASARHSLAEWLPLFEAGRFDLYDALQKLILRVSMRVFFSHDPGDELESIQHATHSIENSFARLLPPWLPTPSNFEFKRDRQLIRTTMRRLVVARRQGETHGDDLLSLLVGLRTSETEQPWTDDEIVDEMLSVYFGASVMSATLTWTLLQLALHPDIQEQLAGAASGVDSSGELAEMEPVQQVVQETMRLFPPSWGFPRYAAEPLSLEGIQLPAKSLLVPMVFHTHRHPRLWDAPEAFRPDRFSAEQAAGRHPFAFYPFGGGQRKCTGAPIAPHIIQLITALTVARYRLSIEPGHESQLRPTFGFEITPAGRVPVQLARR